VSKRSASRVLFVCAWCLVAVGLAGCEPDVGSEAWCTQMDDTPKGDWSVNEAADYAKHCLLTGGN
jgi:hypothetical protein